MEAIKFISKVLRDGHLSLPKDTARRVGKTFEVILIPLEEADVFSYTETLAKEKGFSKLTEKDIEKIIHESRVNEMYSKARLKEFEKEDTLTVSERRRLKKALDV